VRRDCVPLSRMDFESDLAEHKLAELRTLDVPAAGAERSTNQSQSLKSKGCGA
jgi:hypothetical protein